MVNLLEKDAVLTRSGDAGGTLLVSVSGEEPQKLTAALLLESGTGGEARVNIDGKEAGNTPYLHLVTAKTDLDTIRAELQWPGGEKRTYAISLQAGVNAVASATPDRLEHLGLAVFNGLPGETQVSLNGRTEQAKDGLATFTLPEGQYDYNMEGPWLFDGGGGTLEIAASPLATVNLTDAGALVAAEISLTTTINLPKKVDMDIRLYHKDGREAPMRLARNADTLVIHAPAGNYQLALSRSDDPYNAHISPIHAPGQRRTEQTLSELPLSARLQWERARATLARVEKQMKNRKPRRNLGATLLGIGAAGLGTAILSSLMGQEALNTYNEGTTSSDFSEPRSAMDTWNGAFIAGAIVGGVGTVVGTGLLALGPSKTKLEHQRNDLQGKIELYGGQYQTLLEEQPLYGREK